MVFSRSVFDGVLFALDAETGEFVWQTQVGRAKSPEAVIYHDGHIYTDAENYSLVRVDAATGALNWKYCFPPELVLATDNNTEYRVNMPLVCGNDIIYVGVGDTLFCLQDQYDHCCWADMIEPFENVKVLWTYTLTEQSSCGWGGFHSPIISGDKLYNAAFTGEVFCFNATTGDIIWKSNVPETPIMRLEQMSLSDGLVVVASSDRLFCFNAETGAVEWEALNGTFPSSPSIHDGKVFVYDVPGKFCCLDLKTGADIWQFTPKNNSASYYYPTIADGNVYITASSAGIVDGAPTYYCWVQCLDEQTGTLKWEAQLDPGPYKKGYGACVGATSVADGNWYIHNGANGYMYCFGAGPTEISLSVTASSLDLGRNSILYGRLLDQSPASPDAPVVGASVDLYAGTTKIATVTTDDDGMFSTAWTPSTEGVYDLYACFTGNNSYEASNSDTTLIQVGPTAQPSISTPSPTQQTSSPSPSVAPPPTSDTPTTTYIAITAAVVVIIAVAAAVLLRRRNQGN
jgi:outer membrane protein assembly factor BamB